VGIVYNSEGRGTTLGLYSYEGWRGSQISFLPIHLPRDRFGKVRANQCHATGGGVLKLEDTF